MLGHSHCQNVSTGMWRRNTAFLQERSNWFLCVKQRGHLNIFLVILLWSLEQSLYVLFSALLIIINDLSNTASVGGHASDWSLAIHFHAIGWSLVWSLVCLFGSLVHQVRDSRKSQSWKGQTAFSNRPGKRLVACYIFYIKMSWLLAQLNVAYLNVYNVFSFFIFYPF